jgi:hypothetical protein
MSANSRCMHNREDNLVDKNLRHRQSFDGLIIYVDSLESP